MKKSIWRASTAFMLASALVASLSACGASDGSADGELKDTYTVATDSSFVPFEFQENGELVGFDIDLMNAIAEESGFEVTFETTNFDGIIPGLQTGSFDMAIAGIGITEERAKVVDYSDPYYESGLRIGVAEDNESIKSIEDLDGKTVATRVGSTSAAFIKENIDAEKVNQYDQLDQAYLAVENGSADAILYDAPNVAYYIKTAGEGKLKMVGELNQAENYGIAISKGQEALVESVNSSLETLREDGTYEEINNKWFGEDS